MSFWKSPRGVAIGLSTLIIVSGLLFLFFNKPLVLLFVCIWMFLMYLMYVVFADSWKPWEVFQ